MAEMAPPEIAEPALDEVMARISQSDTEASDRLMRIIRSHFNVVQFKKDAVIIDYGQRNRQLMFRHTGSVRIFMKINKAWSKEGWVSNHKDTIFVTQPPYSNRPSTNKMVVEEPAVFVTLPWDDHEYLSGKYRIFSCFALYTAMSFSKEVNRRFRTA